MLAWFQELFTNFAKTLTNVLPVSPFHRFLSSFDNIPYLGWFNWFIPIRDFIVIGTAWLTVIAIFYLYSIVMRWVKMIGD